MESVIQLRERLERVAAATDGLPTLAEMICNRGAVRRICRLKLLLVDMFFFSGMTMLDFSDWWVFNVNDATLVGNREEARMTAPEKKIRCGSSGTLVRMAGKRYHTDPIYHRTVAGDVAYR
ncbi:hypothetical protein ACLOJK_020376 [Asimina triloba]